MPRDLKDLSDTELEAELERRKRKAKNPRPEPLEKPDFSALIGLVTQGVKDLDEKGYEDDDLRQYIYEEVMKSTFGPDYFEWHSKRLKERH